MSDPKSDPTQDPTSDPSALPGAVAAPSSVGALPSVVRTVIVGWAADTLGRLLSVQVPPALIRVARFTPSKRARLGAAALAQAVDADSGFRAAVAEHARSSVRPDDRAEAAAVAHLLRLPIESDLMAELERTAPDGRRAEVVELKRLVLSLQRDLEETRVERDQARLRGLPGAGAADEADKLRRRLREQGTRLRQAVLAQETEAARTHDELASLAREVTRLTDEVTLLQDRARSAIDRADRAQESLGRIREQAGLRRSTADRRLDLLLTTVEGAVAGLRREWDLAGGGSDPADVVAGRLPGSDREAESTADPSRLHSWLGLPAAHLIVDGYNVSKAGYPGLTLAQQRDRLARLLSALSARTGVDVTIVFDGAAVAVPAPPGRGIRVLFSPPGVIADDVIRDLVAAEPSGRVVVVVSSDREVADGVRRRGARTAGSDVLLALLR